MGFIDGIKYDVRTTLGLHANELDPQWRTTRMRVYSEEQGAEGVEARASLSTRSAVLTGPVSAVRTEDSSWPGFIRGWLFVLGIRVPQITMYWAKLAALLYQSTHSRGSDLHVAQRSSADDDRFHRDFEHASIRVLERNIPLLRGQVINTLSGNTYRLSPAESRPDDRFPPALRINHLRS
eukprot:ANDGO_05230.mRNA.1 hypothetical protein